MSDLYIDMYVIGAIFLSAMIDMFSFMLGKEGALKKCSSQSMDVIIYSR